MLFKGIFFEGIFILSFLKIAHGQILNVLIQSVYLNAKYKLFMRTFGKEIYCSVLFSVFNIINK